MGEDKLIKITEIEKDLKRKAEQQITNIIFEHSLSDDDKFDKVMETIYHYTYELIREERREK